MNNEGTRKKTKERSKCMEGEGGSARRNAKKRVNGRVGEEMKERTYRKKEMNNGGERKKKEERSKCMEEKGGSTWRMG